METKTKNISLTVILSIIAVGIWAIVLQNAGVIPTNQNVISNTVDINISAINGHRNAFYDHGLNGVYNRIPVYTGY